MIIRRVGPVEAFGLLAGDVWMPKYPAVLYNRHFNMAGSEYYTFIIDDILEFQDDNEDAVDKSHIIGLMDELLEEDGTEDDEAVVVEEPVVVHQPVVEEPVDPDQPVVEQPVDQDQPVVEEPVDQGDEGGAGLIA